MNVRQYIIRITIILFILSILEGIFFPSDSILKYIRPNFFLPLVIFLGINQGPGKGALSGFFIGLWQDSINFTPLGIHALALCLVGYIALPIDSFFFFKKRTVWHTLIILGIIIEWLEVGMVYHFMDYVLPPLYLLQLRLIIIITIQIIVTKIILLPLFNLLLPQAEGN